MCDELHSCIQWINARLGRIKGIVFEHDDSLKVCEVWSSHWLKVWCTCWSCCLTLCRSSFITTKPCFKTHRNPVSRRPADPLYWFNISEESNMESAFSHPSQSSSSKRKVIAVVGGGLVRITSSLWHDYISNNALNLVSQYSFYQSNQWMFDFWRITQKMSEKWK